MRVQRKFLAWANETLTIEHSAEDLPRIIEIMAKYEDLPADFADASLLALCERLNIQQIASFDGDFEVYRTKDRKRLKNVLARGD